MSEAIFKFETRSVTSSATDSGSGEGEDNGDNCNDMPTSPVKLPKSPSKHSSSKKKSRPPAGSSSKSKARVVQTATRTLYTAGRPPWYNCMGQMSHAFVIGICGGSASGKTTVARKIIEALDVPWVSLLSMDSFYKVLNQEQHEQAAINEYNFDHPDAFDFDLLVETLSRLREGKSVDVPIYNFSTHARESHMKTIYGANVVLFEGIMSFALKELLQLMDIKVFVDTDSDVRLARRLMRDISDRGRDLVGVLKQYNTFVKPAFEHYIEPTMSCADIIVPRDPLGYEQKDICKLCESAKPFTQKFVDGGQNDVAINLIVRHVHTQLLKRGFKLRSKLAQVAMNGEAMPNSLYVLESTSQVQGLHTFIRNKDTPRDEFIFYSKRLMRLLFELARSLLPFRTVRMETPQNAPYIGKKLAAVKLSGVSILRAGETMEQALCEVYKEVNIGKILIQTNLDTGEPELHYLRLSKDIKDHYIMLMDATVATGAAAMMAIRVLLDHDVPEENITLCSLLMAKSGVYSVAYAFPKVKIVTTAVDSEVNDKFHILPGIGNFGDRYFGTDFVKEQF